MRFVIGVIVGVVICSSHPAFSFKAIGEFVDRVVGANVQVVKEVVDKQ